MLIAYLRVSTDEQAKSGLGLDAQLSQIREAFGEPDRVFSDEGISGSTKPQKRPGLSAALDTLKRGDRLVISKVDRLARWFDLTYFLKYDLEQNRKVELLDAEGDLAAPSMQLMFKAAFAEEERKKAIERTKAALDVKKANGEKTGGSVPFGYRVVEGMNARGRTVKCLQADPEEQRVISSIRDLREQGVTYRAICAKLAELEIPTKTGKPIWFPQQIKQVLDFDAEKLAKVA